MNLYVAYEKHEGIDGGCILVVALTARRAKALAWRSRELDNCDEFIDVGVNRIKDPDNCWPLVELEKRNQEHVVAAPDCCLSCLGWGNGIDEKGLCSYCGQPPGPHLVELFDRYAALEENKGL